MPICKRDGFDLNQTEDKHDTFHDNDLVFCCYITKRIFRDYEKYFRHVMAINSTVWQCESTGKDNLTYEEALKSERLAALKLEQFKHSLRAPALLLIEHARQSAMRSLNLITSKFLRKRYFLNEEVSVANKRNTLYKVVGIKLADNQPEPSNGIYEETEQLEYRLRGPNGEEITAPFKQLQRKRTEFSLENLAMFIKNSVTRVDGVLRVKPDVYKEYVTDAQISFASVFIGKMPRYSPAKVKDPAKKQSTLNKYIVKDEEMLAKSKAMAKAKAKTLAEEMERVRLEKQARLAELERQKAQKKAELLQRVEDECNMRMAKMEDLERTDQRMLPRYRPISSLLPDQILGDAFMLREFMHSYQGLLCGMQAFPQNLSFYEMVRAFSAREINGPLSDIFLVLLGTIFDLQKEEEKHGELKYFARFRTHQEEPYITMSHAARTHIYVKRHLAFELNELPLNPQSLSEVLRLHLLASGAQVTERTEKMRLCYRNGYLAREDPGLELRMRHARILHTLKSLPIAKLEFEDIMLVVKCLMAQILSYSAALSMIDERMERMAKARLELRSLVLAENRRLAAVEQSKRTIAKELLQEAGDKPPTEEQTEEMNRRLAELMAQSLRDQRKHKQQMLKAHSELFNYLVFLGMDRCYRKYYVLESIPGIFVEHALDANMDTCLAQPPVNKTPAEMTKEALLPTQRRDLRSYLLKLYGEEEAKASQRKSGVKHSLENSKEDKENQENQLNGHAEPPPQPMEEPLPEVPTASDLYMCSGDPRNCIVHAEQHPKRRHWEYICDPDVIDALIGSLNPLGYRESQLLEAFTQQRPLIDKHIRNCPEQVLSLGDEKKRKRFSMAMQQETQRKYGRIVKEEDANESLRQQLVERIIKLEMDIYEGDLGKLKVKDMARWRQNLIDDQYDPQVKLQWGPGKMESEDGDTDNESHENYDEQELRVRYGQYYDPSEHLDVDEKRRSEQQEEEEEEDPHQVHIHNLACALVQVEQGIEPRFLKRPFGQSKQPPANPQLSHRPPASKLFQWELSLMNSTSYSQIFLHLSVLDDCILWRNSINNSKCKVCRRDTDPMLICDNCNGGTHMYCMRPKLLAVPEGNWYCATCVRKLGFKNSIEEARTTRSRRREIYTKDGDEESDEQEDEEEEEEDEEEKDDDDDHNDDDDADEDEDDYVNDDDESEHEADVRSTIKTESSVRLKIAATAANTRRSSRHNGRPLRTAKIEKILESEDDSDAAHDDTENTNGAADSDAGSEELSRCSHCRKLNCDIHCASCSRSFHMKCVEIGRCPPGGYYCKHCKPKEQQRSRRRPHPDDDKDEEEPQSKRARSARISLRLSLEKSNNNNNNNNNNNTSNQNRNRRSGRRTNDNLPLNSAALYELLEQTMKQQEAWPFLRPVLSSEVPDYHKIIKTPMDLAKIKSKLNMGEYQLNEELLSDIQLVFRNCDEYNVEGNEVYDAGCKLERFVIDRCKDLMLPFRPSDMNGELVC
ncbi:hypothetical protein KR222_009049 [Zaprionus bogoriensis]|nr:hypothetical protein KR222_009049 [Zaprionus bogoriensis]